MVLKRKAADKAYIQVKVQYMSGKIRITSNSCMTGNVMWTMKRCQETKVALQGALSRNLTLLVSAKLHHSPSIW